MKIAQRIAHLFCKIQRKKILQLLRSVNPDNLIKASEKNVLAAFQRAAREVPAYKKLLDSLHINASEITTIEHFKKTAPWCDKYTTFHENNIENLCAGGNLEEVKSLLTSSGHSGVFSFGVNTLRNLKDSSRSIDLGLDYSFDISNKKTLLINCLPMGVKVNTGLIIAETSVREDMVWAVIKKFSPHFQQTILVGEGSFLKKIVEDGATQGINWSNGVFHFITGEEGIAENYRTYLARLLGINLQDPSRGMIGSSMGVAELDLNIFHETRDTIAIRRLAHANSNLRNELFGKDAKVCPMLFVYYPHRTFVEELPSGSGPDQIVISMLSPRMKIPLIRYKTGDLGRILPYPKVLEILKRFGLEKLAPDLKLPLIAVYGRGQCVRYNNFTLYPEEVKEALYSDFSLASSLTGAFKLAKTDKGISLAVQLRKDSLLSDTLQNKFAAALRTFSDAPITIAFHSYYSFPHFMELDYERKFNYI